MKETTYQIIIDAGARSGHTSAHAICKAAGLKQDRLKSARQSESVQLQVLVSISKTIGIPLETLILSEEPTATLNASGATVDAPLLAKAIDAVEARLNETGDELPVEKKAEAISAIYEYVNSRKLKEVETSIQTWTDGYLASMAANQ